MDPQVKGPPLAQVEATWTIYIDGSWCVVGAGVVAILVSPDGRSMSPTVHLDFPTTNNATEYEALLLGLRKAKALGAKRIIIKSESRLMVGHFDKLFTVGDLKIARYLAMVRVATKHFFGITVQTITRGNNEAADKLAKLASSVERSPPNVFYKVLHTPSAATEAQGAAPRNTRGHA